jgi:hypothetical protein
VSGSFVSFLSIVSLLSTESPCSFEAYLRLLQRSIKMGPETRQ